MIPPSVHEPDAKYRGTHDTPAPDGAPLRDVSADRLRGGYSETPLVVLKWRNLGQFDPKSQEHSVLLASILDDPMDRRATIALEGEDAAIVLDILARVRVYPPGRADRKTMPMLSMLILPLIGP